MRVVTNLDVWDARSTLETGDVVVKLSRVLAAFEQVMTGSNLFMTRVGIGGRHDVTVTELSGHWCASKREDDAFLIGGTIHVLTRMMIQDGDLSVLLREILDFRKGKFRTPDDTTETNSVQIRESTIKVIQQIVDIKWRIKYKYRRH